MYIKHALLKGPAHTGAPHFGRLSCVRELFRRQLTCFFTLFPSLHGLFPFLVLYFILFRCPWGEIPVVANRIRPSKGKAKHDYHKQVFCFHSLYQERKQARKTWLVSVYSATRTGLRDSPRFRWKNNRTLRVIGISFVGRAELSFKDSRRLVANHETHSMNACMGTLNSFINSFFFIIIILFYCAACDFVV